MSRETFKRYQEKFWWKPVEFVEYPRAKDITSWEEFRSQYTVRPNGCWEWMDLVWKGYGFAVFEGRGEQAHNITFIVMAGAKQKTMHRDHLCRFTQCVNPFHLEEVTPAENSRRSHRDRPRWTHCHRGHTYDEANTYYGKNGSRTCKTCMRWHEENRKAWRQWVKHGKAAGLPLFGHMQLIVYDILSGRL